MSGRPPTRNCWSRRRSSPERATRWPQSAPDAVDGCREGVPLRGPGLAGEPARSVRRTPSTDRLRASSSPACAAGPSALVGCPWWPTRSRTPLTSIHAIRVLRRFARTAGGHRAPESADGLGITPVHADRRFDADFGVDEWHGTNAFIRQEHHVFRTYLTDARGDEAMGNTWSASTSRRSAARRSGRLAGGLPADPAVRVVDLARRALTG